MKVSPDVLKRLRIARVHRPHTLVFSLTLPIPGVLAVLLGEEVSAALSNIGAGYVTLAMGLSLVIGGIFTLLGLALHRAIFEAMGMCIMALGSVIYGAGVIIGLGLGGVVAGTYALSTAIGMVLRVWSLLTIASDREKWEAYNRDARESR